MQHNYGPQSDIAKEHFALGRLDGVLEGRLVEARANVLRVLEVRGLKVTKKQAALIDMCSDLATLERWHDLAITAKATKNYSLAIDRFSSTEEIMSPN